MFKDTARQGSETHVSVNDAITKLRRSKDMGYCVVVIVGLPGDDESKGRIYINI